MDIRQTVGIEIDDGQCVIDGETIKYGDDRFDWTKKIERQRKTLPLVVSGNAVSAEHYLTQLGIHCLAVGPTTVECYIEEVAA